MGLLCTIIGYKWLIRRRTEKSNVSKFEREPKPMKRLTLEELKALAK